MEVSVPEILVKCFDYIQKASFEALQLFYLMVVELESGGWGSWLFSQSNLLGSHMVLQSQTTDCIKYYRLGSVSVPVAVEPQLPASFSIGHAG